VQVMTCKGVCIRHRAQRPDSFGRYAAGQKLVKCVPCSWYGMDCGVLVVDVELGQNHVIQSSSKN